MALEADAPRAAHHLERLRDSLAKDDSERAAKISRLLSRASKRQGMVPMAFDEMKATAEAARRRLPGETLTTNTPVPHDKETSAPLASIKFPEQYGEAPPILNEVLSSAVGDLLNEWRN